MNNAGLLIYDAGRIYYEEKDSNEMVTLITHLDCAFFRQPAMWEHYFIFRTNRKLIQLNQKGILTLLDSLKENLSPIKKTNQQEFVFGEKHKSTLKYLQDHPDQVTTTLKEIVYYLTQVEGLAQKARNILVTIFTRYSINQNIVEQILFLEKRYNEAYMNSKIQSVRRPRKASLSSRGEKLLYVICMAAEYLLDIMDILKLISLNKSIRRQARETCFKILLSKEKLSLDDRRSLYKMIIPKRYKESEFIEDKEAIAIHPSCARVIKLDLDRTCRTRPEIYKVAFKLLGI